MCVYIYTHTYIYYDIVILYRKRERERERVRERTMPYSFDFKHVLRRNCGSDQSPHLGGLQLLVLFRQTIPEA